MNPIPPAKQPVIACALTPADMEKRTDEFARLARLAHSTTEREDGFDLSFPSEDQIAARLFDFVVTERRCCPFFRFEIVFEPDLGPMRLLLRGPEEAKSLVGPFLGKRGEAS